MTNIKLGDRVKDKISGFEGIVLSIRHKLYNVDQVEIQPYSLREGKPIDSCWFDLPRIELINSR